MASGEGTGSGAARDHPASELGNLQPPPAQTVRFSSHNQEIEPASSLQPATTITPENAAFERQISPSDQAELRNLAMSLQKSNIQQNRMAGYNYEPMSLPASRAASIESASRKSSMTVSPMVSPTSGADQSNRAASQERSGTPSSSRETSYSSVSHPTSSQEQASTRPSTISRHSENDVEAPTRRVPRFSAPDSCPTSRENSPARSSRPGSGTVTPPTVYSRAFTPSGDKDDPYARSRRPPQSRNLDAIDARFIFGSKDSKRSSMASVMGPAAPVPRTGSGDDLKSSNKHHLLPLPGHKRDSDDGSHPGMGKPHGSMADLKRFLHLGGSKKREKSPSVANRSSATRSSTSSSPQQLSTGYVPFAEDHGLESKYGKFGKVLGSGAGGSVRLLKRSSDGVTFAVKQFRERHSYESERDYAKKVTAEFCIGSTLHHGNIIETLDIIQERGHWYEVMEYAPYDLFAIVMTGKMSREEIACSFLQIFNGVTYLHSMGLAHRDLKLDNVVVNEYGIMKLIDFGSATVFRYPFESDIVLASGIVGSDPYLAPEVYETPKYDPRPTDVWSLAIIFACMSLRRFPWKAPRLSDNSFKLFASPPSPDAPVSVAELRRRQDAERERRRQSKGPKVDSEPSQESEEQGRKSATDAASSSSHSTHSSHHHHHHHHHHSEESDGQSVSTASGNSRSEVIKGPFRLLRLLPRESRIIINRMLEIDPKKRATLEEIMDDPWVADTPICRQEEHCRIVRAPGHTHTLVPGTPDHPAPAKV